MRLKLPPLLPWASLLALSLNPAAAAPVITEFLTVNNTGILDEDLTRQDWIEVHNPDAVALDLGGYHLTDDVLLPTRWTFPAGFVIPPGGYSVIFASGKNRAVTGSPLHTNFSLSSAGEYLGLYAPGGGGPALSEFAPAYPVQSADVSYGLLNPVAGTAAAYFNTPSPGAANPSGAAPADPVQFSVVSKTFNQGTSFPLTLTTAAGTASIRYTLNRAVPIAVAGTTGNFTADAATDVLTMTAHGLTDRDEVQVTTNSLLPEGLGLGLNYYVIVLSTNTFKLSDTPGGQPIEITSAGSGTHSVRRHAAYFTAASGLCTTAEHRFYDRDEVRLTTTGTLPAPLAAGTNYYISLTDRNSYRLSATPGGATITTTTAGTGIHTIARTISPAYTATITVNYSVRVRARAFEPGRLSGPVGSESYLMLDATAQAFTSNLPVMLLHNWGAGHPNGTAPGAGTPEDTKQAVWFLFEPKLEGAAMVTRLTNPPDLATPAYFERRGSSTFGATKYSMTMGAWDESNAGRDVSPMGFASNDDFVLNAHYEFDRSLMHNDLIYRLSNEAGRWAPRTRHVEVFSSVNNDVAASGANPAYGIVTGATTGADYYGVYSFQDKISRGTNRIDIDKMTPQDNTPPNVQGGYVFKIDRLDAGDNGIAAGGRTFALVQPKEFTSYPSHLPVATAQQKAYLTGTLNDLYAACLSSNPADPNTGYAAHLDVPAAIDHHILSLVPKSADAFRLSGYWHKPRNGKLVMGPIFDFDRAMGSTDGRDLNPNTWRGDVGDLGTDYFHNASIHSPNYFHYMFQDINFWQAWIDRFAELRQGVLSTTHVHAIIDEYTELLDPGNAANTPAKRNFLKFTAAPVRLANASTPGTNGTFRGETQWLKNWWGKAGAVTANGRLDFIDGQFSRPPVVSPALPAQPLPNPASVTLTSPTLATPGAKIYYTTDGTDPRAAILPATTTISANLVTQTTPVKAIVPTAVINSTIGTTWRGGNEPFTDTSWLASLPTATFTGAGYDPGPGTVDFRPYIGVTLAMQNVNTSCYLRYAFTVPPGGLTGINVVRLRMRYDDGFHAFLNGVPLTSSISPAAAALTWNSASLNGGTHDDGLAIQQENFDVLLSALPANTLREGLNILAIHGLNANLTSSDLVMQAELQAGFRTAPVTNEFTPSATEYTGSLSITQPTRIMARTRHPSAPSDPPTAAGGGTGTVPNGSSWSAPLVIYVFPEAIAASQASVQISEVLYHPAPPSADEITAGYLNSNDFEFVRLTNTGTAPVDLTGIHFTNGLTFTAAPGLQNWLPAGASVVIVENRDAFIHRYGATFTILGEFGGELDDGGEHIVLNDRTGAVISEFIYDDNAPWPASADDGYSLLFTGGNPASPAQWRASLDPGGSSVTTYAGWLRRYYQPVAHPSQPMAQDDDQDGLNNLGEYAFATDPRAPGSQEHATGRSVPGNPLAFAVTRRAGTTDITFTFETSTDLASGNWTAPGNPPTSVVNHGDGTETVTWTAPAAPPGTRLFMRARVTSP